MYGDTSRSTAWRSSRDPHRAGTGCGARRARLAEQFAHENGDDQHTLSARAWRPHGDGADHRRQEVCADTLDEVVSRHALPPPEAIRISVRRHDPQVLSGAAHVLALPGVRAILCSLRSAEQAREVANMLEALGFSADPRSTTAITALRCG